MLLVTVTMAFGATVAFAADASWSGELLDMDCYNKNQAHGPQHAACAEKCVKNGSPMGILTADGKVLEVKTDGSDAKAIEMLKENGGKNVEIMGTASEQDGKTWVTVTSAKAGS